MAVAVQLVAGLPAAAAALAEGGMAAEGGWVVREVRVVALCIA